MWCAIGWSHRYVPAYLCGAYPCEAVPCDVGEDREIESVTILSRMRAYVAAVVGVVGVAMLGVAVAVAANRWDILRHQPAVQSAVSFSGGQFLWARTMNHETVVLVVGPKLPAHILHGRDPTDGDCMVVVFTPSEEAPPGGMQGRGAKCGITIRTFLAPGDVRDSWSILDDFGLPPP